MNSEDRRPLFIAFEGLDGTGKSTVAGGVAEALDAELLTTPSPAVRRFREAVIADFEGSQEAAQLFYLATVFAASCDVRALLARGRSVVLDRYFLSTQAYAAFRGSSLALDDLDHHLTPADVTVFLDAPLAVRVARLAHRETSAADRETLAVGADARLREAHLDRAGLGVLGHFVHVDTGPLSAEEVIAAALAEVERVRRTSHSFRFHRTHRNDSVLVRKGR